VDATVDSKKEQEKNKNTSIKRLFQEVDVKIIAL